VTGPAGSRAVPSSAPGRRTLPDDRCDQRSPVGSPCRSSLTPAMIPRSTTIRRASRAARRPKVALGIEVARAAGLAEAIRLRWHRTSRFVMVGMPHDEPNSNAGAQAQLRRRAWIGHDAHLLRRRQPGQHRGEETWTSSAPLPRRGLAQLSLTVDRPQHPDTAAPELAGTPQSVAPVIRRPRAGSARSALPGVAKWRSPPSRRLQSQLPILPPLLGLRVRMVENRLVTAAYESRQSYTDGIIAVSGRRIGHTAQAREDGTT
jgi:hypothetical protein